jgi:hypothetical protein
VRRYISKTMRTTHDFIIDGFADSIINGTAPPFLPTKAESRFESINMIVDKLARKSA